VFASINQLNACKRVQSAKLGISNWVVKVLNQNEIKFLVFRFEFD
jgi:hypothetical protein